MYFYLLVYSYILVSYNYDRKTLTEDVREQDVESGIWAEEV
jgi:hypothetical protein